MIVEIGFDLADRDHALEELEQLLMRNGYAFYTEPPDARFVSLEDLECQCEGK